MHVCNVCVYMCMHVCSVCVCVYVCVNCRTYHLSDLLAKAIHKLWVRQEKFRSKLLILPCLQEPQTNEGRQGPQYKHAIETTAQHALHL